MDHKAELPAADALPAASSSQKLPNTAVLRKSAAAPLLCDGREDPACIGPLCSPARKAAVATMMLLGFSLLALPCFRCTTAAQESNSASLNFQIEAAGFKNYVFRDNLTAATVLLPYDNSTAAAKRLVVAQPGGNSGLLTFFEPLANSTSPVQVQLVNGTLVSTTATDNRTGIQFDLSLNASAQIGVTIIGAVRAVRDYTEGNGVMHEIFNYTVTNLTTQEIFLHRKFINSSLSYDLIMRPGSNARFDVAASNNGTYTPPTMQVVQVDASSPAVITVQALTNVTSLHGLGPQSIFRPEGSAADNATNALLSGLNDGTAPAAQQLSFLGYEETFFAGSWRFLTYFGRDTMITAQLTLPILQATAVESIMSAVLDRINSTGALCHEETVGDYASFINIENNRTELGDQPYYDYKMIDTDLILLPLLSSYLERSNASAVSAFLDGSSPLANNTYRTLLDRNIEYNLGRTAPFAADPVYSNLIALRDGEPVGNWRDSNAGLGFGQYPFDVNTALVPAALQAIVDLSQAGVINSSYASNASAAAAVWQNASLPLFQVDVSTTDATSRLSNFVTAANLSMALLGNSTSNSTNQPFSFYALSLKEDGSKVEVLNSDLSFSLLYGTNVSASLINATIAALQPFPRGLLTNAGLLVASASYSSNTTDIDTFNTAAYHGSVSWSFVQAMMAQGVARQLAFCEASSPPAWCSSLQGDLKAAETRLWQAINGAPSQRFAEVWSNAYDGTSNSFSVVDLGSVSGTESDAIQFWSYSFLATPDPTS